MNRRTIALILLICQLSYPASAGFYEGLIAAQKEDWDTALAEWLPIANEGNPGAQSNIGNMYAHGLGVEKDIIEAYRWHLLAANQSVTKSMVFVGLALSQGLGVEKNMIQAATWLLAAERLGSYSATEAYGAIKRDLLPNQIEEATRLAEAWGPGTSTE